MPTMLPPEKRPSLERLGNAREQCEAKRSSRYACSTPCLITLEITGAHEQAPLRGAMHVGVRVD